MNFYQILKYEKINEFVRDNYTKYKCLNASWTFTEKLKDEVECFRNIDIICLDSYVYIHYDEIERYLKKLNEDCKYLYHGKPIEWRLPTIEEGLEIRNYCDGLGLAYPFWTSEYKVVLNNVNACKKGYTIGKKSKGYAKGVLTKFRPVLLGVIKDGERE